MAEPLGELEVLIGGDLSNLDAAIQEAQGHAETGAQAIASAFAVPDLAQPMADSLGNLGTAIEGVGTDMASASGQMGLFDSAAAAIDSASASAAEQLTLFDMNAIAAAESMAQAGDAAASAAPQFEEAGHAAEHGAEGGHELSSTFGELGEHLTEFAGILGIATGIEEFGREALESAARVERFVGSMTVLTGSTEAAEEAVTRLKDLALEDALSFPALLQADQRMTAMGFDAQHIDETLRSVADTSRALGREFETVSNAVERMALSGAAGNRQLIQLGISTGELATAMGVSEASAKEMFKALDEAGRLDVLNAAMQKFAGTAKATAQDMTGSWQTFKTQLELTAEAMGQIAGPVATFMLGGLQRISEWLSTFIEFMSGGLKKIEEWITAATDFVGITDASARAGMAWSNQLSEQAKQIEINIERNTRIKEAVTAHKDALTAATAAVGAHVDKLREAVLAYDRSRDSVGELNSAWMHALEIAIQTKDRLGEQVAAFEKVAKAVDAVTTAHEAWGTKLDTIHSKISTFIPEAEQAALDLASIQIASDQVNTSLETAQGKWESNIDVLAATAGTMADVNAALQAIVESQNQVSDGSDLVAQAMQSTGIVSASVTDGIVANLRNVFNRLIELRNEYGDASGQIQRDLNAVGGKITEIEHKHDDLKGKVASTQSDYEKMCKQVNEVLEADVAKALGDIIFQTGKIGDDFVKLGKSIVDIVLNHIIKEALEPLLNMLDNILGKIFGGGGGGGVLGTSVGAAGGAAGDIAGGAGGIAGGVGGLLGSITGIVGAVGSVVGAIGTFIEGGAENTKLFHIETSLVEIRNTLQNYHDPIWRTAVATEYILGQLHDVDYPLFSQMVKDLDEIARHSGTGGTGGTGGTVSHSKVIEDVIAAVTDSITQDRISRTLHPIVNDVVDRLGRTLHPVVDDMDRIGRTLHPVVDDVDFLGRRLHSVVDDVTDRIRGGGHPSDVQSGFAFNTTPFSGGDPSFFLNNLPPGSVLGVPPFAQVSGFPSVPGGSPTNAGHIVVNITVPGAGDPTAVAHAVFDHLRTVLPQFAAASG